MPRLKIHLPSRPCNHKSLCGLGHDLHALGMRAPLSSPVWDVITNPCPKYLILEHKFREVSRPCIIYYMLMSGEPCECHILLYDVAEFGLCWWPFKKFLANHQNTFQTVDSPRNSACHDFSIVAYCETSDISHLWTQLNCKSFRCSWSIVCWSYSNYILILYLTPGFNGLWRDNCRTS